MQGKTLEERNPYYWQVKKMHEGEIKPKNTKELIGLIDWSDLSKFVLLCGSCHSKVERMRDFYGKYRPPMLKLLDDIVKEAKERNK